LRERGEDDVSQLDAVIRQTINKVKVEVTEEFREVMEDDETHSQGGMVKGNHGRRTLLTGSHVQFEEGEQTHNELSVSEVLVIEDVVRVGCSCFLTRSEGSSLFEGLSLTGLARELGLLGSLT
jgi:hypothetical protein